MKRLYECWGCPHSLPPPPLSQSAPLLSLEGPEPDACALEARGTLDMSHPFSILSGHAEQDCMCAHARTHTHTHTHTHTGKYTKPALSPPFAVSVLFWRDGPQPQSFKQLSASLELTGQLVDCSRKYRSSPRSWAGMLSSTPEPGYASPGPPYFTADLELARSPDTACQLL